MLHGPWNQSVVSSVSMEALLWVCIHQHITQIGSRFENTKFLIRFVLVLYSAELNKQRSVNFPKPEPRRGHETNSGVEPYWLREERFKYNQIGSRSRSVSLDTRATSRAQDFSISEAVMRSLRYGRCQRQIRTHLDMLRVDVGFVRRFEMPLDAPGGILRANLPKICSSYCGDGMKHCSELDKLVVHPGMRG